MIFYDPNLNYSLANFGISIPLLDIRASKTFEFLQQKFGKDHPLLISPIYDHSQLTRDDLLLAHNEKFVDSLLGNGTTHELMKCFELIDEDGNYHRFDPDSAIHPLGELKDLILMQAHASYLTMKSALENKEKFSFFLGGGMHHSMSFGGRGFCLVNDIVIGLRKLQKENLIKNAWVIDVDAHKGDGTAELTCKDNSIKTLSIHMKDGWPLDGTPFNKETNNLNPWFIPSTLDVPIGENDCDKYLLKLREGLLGLEALTSEKVDIAIVVCGADPYELDQLPSSSKIKLTLGQMLDRDLWIYNFLKERSIPQCFLIAGGYGEYSWEVYANFLDQLVLRLTGSVRD